MLKIEGLTKKYDDFYAVRDISFTLDNGVYGLLGPNGAGKTTLMNMLTLEVNPTKGNILWNGDEITKIEDTYLKILGYMPQQQEMYPNYTVEEFVYYMAALHGMNVKMVKERTDFLLKKLELLSKRNEKIKTLSGGMKQRVLLLQAIIHSPQLLVLDEPTAGLDPEQRIIVRNLIMELAVDCIVIIATHVVQDVELISKEIILMRDGKMIKKDSAPKLCLELEKKVYEKTVSKSEINNYMDRYIVTAIKENTQGKYIIRLLTENTTGLTDSHEVTANLEDVSLYYLGKGKTDGTDKK